MDFVGPFIGPIVEALLGPVKKHLGFLVSSTENVTGMNNKMDQLEITAQEVQDDLDKAVLHTEVVPAHAQPWLKEVENLKIRRNSIEATGCFNVIKRYKAGKQSFKLVKEIEDLENRKSKIIFTHEQKCLAEVGSTSAGPSASAIVSMGTQNNFESRDSIFNGALQALRSNKESESMIALCGMAGVGKTTMMEQLEKVVKDLGMFAWVVKVVIGENNDPYSLQKAVAEYTGECLNETTISARADRLREMFEVKSQQGNKKNLVIIDDLWKKFDLKDVGLSPLPNGFKLLFTSRFENVCTAMGVQDVSIFKVGVLSDTESRTLFSEHVGQRRDSDDDELQRIKEDIVKKCGGLPIAIVTIARTLSGNIKEAWQKALRRLERDDLKDLEEITHKIFEMSYENLKEDDDKAIFLLCGLFPDDFNIHKEDLLRYGWGLRFFEDVEDLATARSHTEICVNNLIRANLLIESDVDGCVKMHDLVRAFVLSNSSKVKQASIVNHDKMSWDRLTKDSYERILLKGTGLSGFHANFNYQHLSFLMLMDWYGLFKLPEDMHNIMKKLEVVSYENMGIPVLPTTFEHSTTLRTLCLRSCSLSGDISSLGSLCNLETLSLVHCNIRRLPSAIGKLKKLKLLDLTGCVDLYIDQGVLQDLKDSLEELYMRASKGSPVKFTPANFDELEQLSQGLYALELEFITNKPQLKNVFKNLKRFRLSIGCELKSYEKYSFRNTLNLVAECNELKECNIWHLFKETEELRLQVKYMIHLEDVSLHHTFSQLRYLHVSKCAELQYLFTVDVANGLKKLEQLTISKCPVLKTLIGGENNGVEVVILKKLERLTISKCPVLKTLIGGENNGAGVVTLKKLNFMSLEDLPEMVSLCDNVIELPELLELKLARLPNFTSIYPDSNINTSSMQPLFNKEGAVPKLEKLDICMMENLKQIWPCQISTSEKNEVSMLRQITVTECDSLINLFPINPLPLLNHLEEVLLAKCGSIEVLFNIDFESVCEMGEHRTSKLRNIEVVYLRELKELWRIEGVNESHTLVNGFKDVQAIHIDGCDNFTDIFTPTTTNFDLGALTDYHVCDNFVERERKKKMIESDQKDNVTYPSYLMHNCHHLQKLQLWNDGRVGEVVFDMDSPSRRQLATIQPPILLPHLERISLFGLKEMSHVWKCCNWNRFLIPQYQPLQFPFQNLTRITLSGCHKIKYLFSPLMAKYLSNLKSVAIYDCNGIEEVISSRDDENTSTSISTSSHPNTTFFRHFDDLILIGLPCLKRIDGDENTWSTSDKISTNVSDTSHDHFQSGQVCWSLFPYLRSIYIERCDALSSLIPWYAVGQMKRLQILKIQNCSGMTEVFENELTNNNTNNNVDEGSGAATSLTSINSTTVVHVPQLSNLKTVCIYNCDLLPHIFTFSTLKSLDHLKELKVKRCKAMKVIIEEENETSSEVVKFPLLETLELDDLPNLKGFFLGMNDFLLPSLVNVMINDCDEWMVFTSGQLETPNIKYLHTNFGKHSLEHGFSFQATFPTSLDPTISKGTPSSFHNLIEINIQKRDVGTSIIPSHVLLQLEKLQQITIESCKGVKEVFEVVAVEGSGFNASQTVVQIPNLTQVMLSSLYDLKHLWKSNQWMVLEFPNLTTVDIHFCSSLEHVFTCSMAGSLVQLQRLTISNCNDIKMILKEEEECDAKVNEIVLPRLNYLHLHFLSSLKGFCIGKVAFSLPALETLSISNCPSITVFTKGHVSTPELKVIDTSFGKCDVRTDLNSFIETKQEEGHEF